MERLLKAAMATRRSTGLWSDALEQLEHPVYVTDEEGYVTHYNQLCLDLYGQKPKTSSHGFAWRLYTEAGAPLPGRDSPVQLALRERVSVRGVVVLVERPDGTRVACQPYPMPIYDRAGKFCGAINLVVILPPERLARRAFRAKLVDISDAIRFSDRALAALLQ